MNIKLSVGCSGRNKSVMPTMLLSHLFSHMTWQELQRDSGHKTKE